MVIKGFGPHSGDASLKQSVSSFTSHLVAALRNSLIYNPNHSQVEYSLGNAEKAAEQVFSSIQDMTFVCIEKELLFSGAPMNKAGLHFVKLAEFMQSLEVQRLVFLPGLKADEIRRFIIESTGIEAPEGDSLESALKSSSHIKVGRLVTGRESSAALKMSRDALVRLLAQGMASEEELNKIQNEWDRDEDPADELDEKLLEEAREAINNICSGKASGAKSLEDALDDFLKPFLKYAETLFGMEPLKDHDLLTYIHSVNVAVLSAAQAARLGLARDVFKDIALAGLYHDYGKINIPSKVLNKAKPLTQSEKGMLAGHAASGARILANVPNMPRIAVTAAYEHHRHYSGAGGYPKSHRRPQPGMVSQMVMLADFHEAILTDKPYRKARPFSFSAELLQKRSGSQFHPGLVRNFANVLKAFGDSSQSSKEA